MPRTGGLALIALSLLVGGCRERGPVVEQPDQAPVAVVEQVDTLAVCEAGCERLTRCAPDLSDGVEGDAGDVGERIASECNAACLGFTAVSPQTPAAGPRLVIAREVSFALQDCLGLESCNAFWGCVSSDDVRPWLGAVAPVGERSCENLCSQASACAIARVCEDEATKSSADPATCLADDARRDELDETCLLQCAATPDDSQARRELVGCIDHVSCSGMLGCLDSWSETAYEVDPGRTPGISQTCDEFCTRAIDCGAEAEGIDLTADELARLREAMTSTWVECGVQCEKDIGQGTRPDTFETCTAAADCAAFQSCADAA